MPEVWVLAGLLGPVIPLSDHLRGLIRVKSHKDWWDRTLQTLCEVEMNSYGVYDVILGICYGAGVY